MRDRRLSNLGHAQISITLDTYSHVLPSMGRGQTRRAPRYGRCSQTVANGADDGGFGRTSGESEPGVGARFQGRRGQRRTSVDNDRMDLRRCRSGVQIPPGLSDLVASRAVPDEKTRLL